METLNVTTFETAHLAGALKLSRAVSWPHRMEDWALLLSLSRGVVILDGETVLATALATPMGPVATASMIIVDGARRGAGLGRRVVEAAMARIAPREWRLIATQDGLPLYERMGFETYGEILQFQGMANPSMQNLPLPQLASEADLASLTALDRATSGTERPALFAALLAQGRIVIMREGNRIVAFAAQRRFGRGMVIGPVIARDRAEAQALIDPLIASCAGQFVRIDMDADCGLASWVAARGLAHAGVGIKMRKGLIAEPAGPQKRFALAAQSLG